MAAAGHIFLFTLINEETVQALRRGSQKHSHKPCAQAETETETQ
jgi:hypothetical protein